MLNDVSLGLNLGARPCSHQNGSLFPSNVQATEDPLIFFTFHQKPPTTSTTTTTTTNPRTMETTPPPTTTQHTYTQEQQDYINEIAEESRELFPAGKVFPNAAALRQEVKAFASKKGCCIEPGGSKLQCSRGPEPGYRQNRREKNAIEKPKMMVNLTL